MTACLYLPPHVVRKASGLPVFVCMCTWHGWFTVSEQPCLCVTVRAHAWLCVPHFVFVSHLVQWVQRPPAAPFPSLASASRTEACKDMHAFILM